MAVDRDTLATVGDVAHRLNLSKPRVYELGRSGRLPRVKVGPGLKGSVRFRWEDVELFILEHRGRASTAA